MKGKVSASNLPISSDIIKRQEEKLKQDRANLDVDFQSDDMRNFMQKDEKSVWVHGGLADEFARWSWEHLMWPLHHLLQVP